MSLKRNYGRVQKEEIASGQVQEEDRKNSYKKNYE